MGKWKRYNDNEGTVGSGISMHEHVCKQLSAMPRQRVYQFRLRGNRPEEEGLERAHVRW